MMVPARRLRNRGESSRLFRPRGIVRAFRIKERNVELDFRFEGKEIASGEHRSIARSLARKA